MMNDDISLRTQNEAKLIKFEMKSAKCEKLGVHNRPVASSDSTLGRAPSFIRSVESGTATIKQLYHSVAHSRGELRELLVTDCSEVLAAIKCFAAPLFVTGRSYIRGLWRLSIRYYPQYPECYHEECLLKIHSCPLMELRLNPPIPNAVDLQLESQTGAVNNHFQCEVQIVEFHASGGGEPRE
jgi:hypothetical protein